MKPSVITQVNITKILNWLRNQIPTTTFNDIKAILKPCCVPVVDYGTFTCGSTVGVTGIIFNGFTVTHPTLLGQTVQIVITAPEYLGAGATTTVTLDATGTWTGNIQTSFEGAKQPSPIPLTITTSLIPVGSSVVHKSATQLISLPNCD